MKAIKTILYCIRCITTYMVGYILTTSFILSYKLTESLWLVSITVMTAIIVPSLEESQKVKTCKYVSFTSWSIRAFNLIIRRATFQCLLYRAS